MIGAGLIGEVEGLVARGYSSDLNAFRSVGYQETLAYLEGLQSFDETIAMIKRNSRRYAKRQMTWFRRDPRIRWIDWDPQRMQECADCCMALFAD
jgi:tRNA dimethylallyltransferase